MKNWFVLNIGVWGDVGIMSDDLANLAKSAANAIVSAMAADSWKAAKRGFAALVGHEHQLESTHANLAAKRGRDLDWAKAEQARDWVIRLQDILDSNPGMAPALQALIANPGAAPEPVTRSQFQHADHGSVITGGNTGDIATGGSKIDKRKFRFSPLILLGHAAKQAVAHPAVTVITLIVGAGAVSGGVVLTHKGTATGRTATTEARDAQPAQTTSPPRVGSYTGTNPQNGQRFTFYVSGSQTTLQDISIPLVDLTCAPGGTQVQDHLGIASIPLNANGSFSATATKNGIYDGYPATFTYTFSGNFHGEAPSGAAGAAGSFSETLAYTGSTAYTCTSGSQSWTAAEDAQPAQTTSPPPVGSYTGTNPQNGQPFTFYVSGSQTTLQDISIPLVDLTCAPGGTQVQDHLGIASIPLNANGSFSATATKNGIYDGYPATFTYTFSGNFHGEAPSGAARAAGSFSETLAYTGSTAYTCTSDNQSWTATLTSDG